MGLHHLNGDWVVDDNGARTYAEGDFWTLRILAEKMGLTIKDIYYHRSMGRFPTLRIEATKQYLVLPAVGAAIAAHYLENKTWLTFRIVDGEIRLYDEPWGSRPAAAQVLAETGRLHEPPAGSALAIVAPLDVPD